MVTHVKPPILGPTYSNCRYVSKLSYFVQCEINSSNRYLVLGSDIFATLAQKLDDRQFILAKEEEEEEKNCTMTAEMAI